MKWRVSDTVTYARSWTVEARTEDEAISLAQNQGPRGGVDFVEDQTDATPYEAKRITIHKHRWVEDTLHAPSGCGAEWFYECTCGASKYVCEDQGKRTTEITEAEE